MCGRTALSLNKDQVQCACSYKATGKDLFEKPVWLEEHNDGKRFSPSYNIAPTDVTPVLLSSSKYKNSVDSARVLKPMMWGIIPPWHTGDYKKHSLSTNNCRLENINTSKLYSPILNNGGRCIIVIEGFYEWQTTDKTAKVKQPYYIYNQQPDGLEIDKPETWKNTYSSEAGWKGIKLMFLAGLYNIWQNEETMLYSYSIITMNSNSTFDWLHHRMPAILDTEEQIDAWLNIDDVKPDMALSYLMPIKILHWHQVSTDVNNSRNKSEACNKKKSSESNNKPQQKTLTTWFKKAEKRKSTEDSLISKKLKTNL